MARSGINKVILVGNLGKDPDMRYTAGGDAVANLSIATSESWNDNQTGEKKEKTEWHRVVFFGRSAEIIDQYVKKGQELYIEGSLSTSKYEKDGIERYTTNIIGSSFNFISGSGSTANSSNSQQFNDDINQDTNNNASDKVAKDEFDDDIPF